MPTRKLLILGGTREAAELAKKVIDQFNDELSVVVSYAGVTGRQPDLPCEVRVGGFGGIDGLSKYLKDNEVDFLIDASHPYAGKISQHASQAARMEKCPILHYERPEWKEETGDNWIHVADMAEAAIQVKKFKKKTFLSIGIKELDSFYRVKNVPILVRLLKRPDDTLMPANFEVVEGRPPFSIEDEKSLFIENRIDLLVTKNSGGDLTQAKIIAARQLELPVIVVDRPISSLAETASEINGVLQWLEGQFK